MPGPPTDRPSGSRRSAAPMEEAAQDPKRQRPPRGRSQTRPAEGVSSSQSIHGSKAKAAQPLPMHGSVGSVPIFDEPPSVTFDSNEFTREVIRSLAPIRTAVQNFAMDAPIFIDTLNRARNNRERGVEAAAATITNAVNATNRQLSLACEEELDGFVIDLKGFQGPGRIPLSDEESVGSRAQSDIRDQEPSDDRRKHPGWTDERTKEWLMDESPPTNIQERGPAPTGQRRHPGERQDNMEYREPHNPWDRMNYHDQYQSPTEDWALRQYPSIGFRWSKSMDHPYATGVRSPVNGAQGCYYCAEFHRRPDCPWKDHEHDIDGSPLLGDELLGKGFVWSSKGGKDWQGGMIKGGYIDVTPKGKGKGKGAYYLDRGVPSSSPNHTNDNWHRRRSTVSQQQHDARHADRAEDSGVA